MIAITLPRKLIDKIISGEKTIEVRKDYPSLESLIMTVYVVEKGTKNVPIAFKVDSKILMSPSCLWRNYADQLGITYGEFLSYVKDSILIYAWHICKVKELSPTFDIDCLGIKKAPQSYVYINKERRNQK